MGLMDRVSQEEREQAARIERAVGSVRRVCEEQAEALGELQRAVLRKRLDLQCDVLLEPSDVQRVLDDLEAAAAELRMAVEG